MQNSQYFQPMQHKPLTDIRKYAIIARQGAEYMTLAKPAGIDVFIRNGQIFDFNQKELTNQYLKFHFEKLLQTSINMQMLIIGVLVTDNTENMLSHRYPLYSPSKASFDTMKFLVYDIRFPVFNAEHDYRWRYDIADKVVGRLPNCEILAFTTVKNETDLNNVVRDTFETDVSAEVISYRADGKFVPGESQLFWDDVDTVSYVVRANQRYRGHIKRIVSTTEQRPNGDKTEIALYLVARFKKEYINVPIKTNNLALRAFLWQHRKDLKSFPFWFTGYTYMDDVVGTSDYVTVVNEFLAFIPTSDACPIHGT